ncbi:MAG: GreA/GreB family elongation factor [Alphaproteobacteria bacterium]
MSRAFVKEPDGDLAGEDQPERPQSPHPNYITPEGLVSLKAKLASRHEERRRLLDTRDEPSSKLALAQLDRDIRYLEGRIERAIPVDPENQPGERVCFGAHVTLETEEGESRAFTIVGEDEADAQSGRVSWVSPLARALLGARVGEFITWPRPAGDLEAEILEIRYPESRSESKQPVSRRGNS